MNKKSPKRLRGVTIILQAVFWVIAILIGGCALIWVLLWYFLNPGRFDRDQMNAIVDVVRQQRIGVDNWSAFQIDDFSNPKATHVVTDEGPRNVWAQRTIDGFLGVSIKTKDRGHFGDYGFAYSDVPLIPKTFEGAEGRTFLVGITPGGHEAATPGPMQDPREKIDEHWWKVWDSTR